MDAKTNTRLGNLLESLKGQTIRYVEFGVRSRTTAPDEDACYVLIGYEDMRRKVASFARAERPEAQAFYEAVCNGVA